MNYIPATEFLKQSEKVQKEFLDWWKPQIGERVFSTGISSGEFIICENPKQYQNSFVVFDLKSHIIFRTAKNVFIPLPTETQLRKFIEDKDYKYIGINNFLTKNSWNIKVFDNMMKFEPDFEFTENTVLMCLWQVACEIAEGVE